MRRSLSQARDVGGTCLSLEGEVFRDDGVGGHARIHYTKWTGATGTDRYGCEVMAEKADFLNRPTSAEKKSSELVDRDDEIPF